MKYFLGITTFPDLETARSVSKKLLEYKLCACINVLEGADSLYWWEGKIQEEKEVIVFIKTKEQNISLLKEKIKELHPYQVPELIFLQIEEGLKEYLNWVEREC